MIEKINALKGMSFGPDMICIASADRFDSDDAIFKILPETKSVICLGYRILRGTHRGIEEGTSYHHYTTMAIEVLEETVMPMMTLRLSRILEEEGFIALPQRRTQTIMQQEDSTNPEILYNKIYRGKTAEYQMNFEDAAAKCGLGEIGMSGTLLTEDYGPLQRYCFVLTDAELPATPVFVPHICDNCGECVKACPGNAIHDKKKEPWQCAAYYAGANMSKNPFMSQNAFPDKEDRLDILNGRKQLDSNEARELINEISYYPPIMHSYISSICGNACDRACFIHLEETGALGKKFKNKFRRRDEWVLDVK